MERERIELFIFIIAVSMGIIYMNVWQHEKLHEKVFNYLNCTNTTLSLYWWGGEVTCNEYPENFDYFINMAFQMDIDNIGYQIVPNLLLMVVFLLLMLCRMFQSSGSVKSSSSAYSSSSTAFFGA